MKDFTQEVNDALSDVCPRTFFYYPNTFEKMPAISFFDIANGSEDNRDLLTSVGFQVDIWSKTVAECKSVALAADIAMRGLGFRRSFSMSAPDPGSGYRHQSMKFNGTYNAIDQKIHPRS